MKNLIWEDTGSSLKFKTLEVNGFQIFGEIEYCFEEEEDISEKEEIYYFNVKVSNGKDTIVVATGFSLELEGAKRQVVENIEKHMHLALQAYSRLMFEHFEETQLP